MTDFKICDRVKVEFETRVGSPSPAHKGRSTTDDEGRTFFLPDKYLTLIEPEYEAGEMYVDADGDYFCYLPEWDEDMPWYAVGHDIGYRDSALPRPLRKLVPEGEAK